MAYGIWDMGHDIDGRMAVDWGFNNSKQLLGRVFCCQNLEAQKQASGMRGRRTDKHLLLYWLPGLPDGWKTIFSRNSNIDEMLFGGLLTTLEFVLA